MFNFFFLRCKNMNFIVRNKLQNQRKGGHIMTPYCPLTPQSLRRRLAENWSPLDILKPHLYLLTLQVLNVPETSRLPVESSRHRASLRSIPTTWNVPLWSLPPRWQRSWWSLIASTWSLTPRRHRAPSADTTGWRSGTASLQVSGGLGCNGQMLVETLDVKTWLKRNLKLN